MIELRHLTKLYGNTVAVSDLSIQVSDGEFLVLLGGSGCGKTTTLKMVNRLVEPSGGSVWIDGRNSAELVPFELRRKIGYTFQQVGLFPHMTVAENIAVTPTLLGWPPRKIQNRVSELLDLVGLDSQEVRERSPTQLSGGQQQRIGVARALAAKPRVMLLDEPFGALDPLTRQRLQEFLAKLRHELSLTIVFVTHDIAEALKLADRIAIMQKGTLRQIGTPSALMREPADDYVRQLLDAPRREAQLVETLLTGNSSSSKNIESDEP